MQKYSVLINKFDGGLNTKATPLHGLPNESPDCQDVVFDDLGAVGTRRGSSVLNSSAMGTYPVDLLHTYIKNDGTQQLMAICNNSMFRASGTTMISIPSAQSVYTQRVNVEAVNFQNKMFISNGYAQPYKWNGTEFTQWGVSAPSACTAAKTADAGLLDGSYKYVILGVNSNSVQGNYGSASTEITCASEQGVLTDIPVFPTSAGVESKLVCRNTAGVSDFYYVVTSISNAQTSYTDNAADSVLSTEAPTDNGLPPYFTTLLPHQGRIFGASKTSDNPMFLWYSDVNEPETFSSTAYLRIGEGDGYPITGLAVLGNNLIVAKNDGEGNGSMYLVYMPDATPANWSIAKLDTAYGGQSPRVMTKFANFICYINRYGVFDLSELAVGDIKSDAISYNIEPDMFTLAKSYLDVACAITWKNKVWISVPYGTTQQTNNRIYQYDFVRGRTGQDRSLGAWSRFTDMAISDFAIYDGKLYGGSSDDTGFIYELDTGYDDNGSAINSYYKTMAIQGQQGHENYTKQWREAMITVESTGDWFMELAYINNFDEGEGNTIQISLDPGGDEWGSAIIGQDTWGPGFERKKVKIRFRNSVSKAIQLKFSTNASDEYFKVHEIQIFYNLRGLR